MQNVQSKTHSPSYVVSPTTSAAIIDAVANVKKLKSTENTPSETNKRAIRTIKDQLSYKCIKDVALQRRRVKILSRLGPDDRSKTKTTQMFYEGTDKQAITLNDHQQIKPIKDNQTEQNAALLNKRGVSDQSTDISLNVPTASGLQSLLPTQQRADGTDVPNQEVSESDATHQSEAQEPINLCVYTISNSPWYNKLIAKMKNEINNRLISRTINYQHTTDPQEADQAKKLLILCPLAGSRHPAHGVSNSLKGFKNHNGFFACLYLVAPHSKPNNRIEQLLSVHKDLPQYWPITDVKSNRCDDQRLGEGFINSSEDYGFYKCEENTDFFDQRLIPYLNR